MVVQYSIIAAITNDGGLGANGTIPWNIKQDLVFFKNITTNTILPNTINAVIMGRNTWESLPSKFKPLSNRINIVVSKSWYQQKHRIEGVHIVSSLDHAHLKLKDFNNIYTAFVIGGSLLYKEAIFHHYYTKAYITRILSNSIQCDVFFPIDYFNKRYPYSKLLLSGNENNIQFCSLEFSQDYIV